MLQFFVEIKYPKGNNKMFTKRKAPTAENEISELYTFSLGGYEQKVLIEGRNSALPVVITLHGGPGSPIPFSVGCRGLFPEFTDKFIMVYWDQLGCGINNHKIDEHFTVESFTDMTIDLIKEVKKLFPGNTVCLFAMSWGSLLSAKVLEKSGDIADAVVVYGQIVKNLFLNEEVLRALEASGMPRRKLELIKRIDKNNPSPKDLQMISSGIRKYTDGYQNKKGRQAPIGRIVRGLLTSPDYKLKDLKTVILNGYRGNLSLWKEILTIDLSDILKNVRIPYIILQGDTDIVTSTEEIQRLVETAGNPFLKCQVVSNSGHMPGSEGMELVLKMLNSPFQISM